MSDGPKPPVWKPGNDINESIVDVRDYLCKHFVHHKIPPYVAAMGAIDFALWAMGDLLKHDRIKRMIHADLDALIKVCTQIKQGIALEDISAMNDKTLLKH
jgi:hypothetical protein